MVWVRFVQVHDFTAWKIHDKLTWVSFLLVLHQCRLLTFYSCPFSLFYRHLPRTHPRKNAQRENILVFFTLKAYRIRHGPTLQLIISDIWQFEEKGFFLLVLKCVKSQDKVWGKKTGHTQKLAMNKKSMIFVLSSWNLVKMIASCGDHFHLVSWG